MSDAQQAVEQHEAEQQDHITPFHSNPNYGKRQCKGRSKSCSTQSVVPPIIHYEHAEYSKVGNVLVRKISKKQL